MKVIVYDHTISFKRGGRYLEMYAKSVHPFEIKGGDSVRLDHQADVSVWEIIKCFILQEPLIINSSKNQLQKVKGGDVENESRRAESAK